MTDHPAAENSALSGAKMALAFGWLLSLVLVGYVGFVMGQGAKTTENELATTDVLNAMTSPTSLPSSPPSPSSLPIPSSSVCAKSGYAQKWEYLTSYTVKDKDSITAIAESELGDASRANEIIQLNSLPLVAQTTIYLPPQSIKKSNGHLKQVHGRILTLDASSWRLSFNNEEKGRGILIPSYWFDSVDGKDNYKVGDCVSVLFDEGFKVFAVTPQ